MTSATKEEYLMLGKNAIESTPKAHCAQSHPFSPSGKNPQKKESFKYDFHVCKSCAYPMSKPSASLSSQQISIISYFRKFQLLGLGLLAKDPNPPPGSEYLGNTILESVRASP